jgi:N-methylhydantoinase B
MTADETGIDSVTREIIRGKLLAVADEMGIVIAKTSMSPVIYEVLDFACGICDAEGQLIVQTNGITLFTGTFALQVKAIMRKHGDTLRPGDVFLTNDPFEGGTHTCDIALIKPIFVDDRLLAFAISVAHWSEVGGAVTGSISPTATEIYQEGIRFPGIRVCRDDELIGDVVELIRENVRLPVQSLGDLNAELAAVRIAETRLREILDRYGAKAIEATFEHILETSERLSRAAVAALPDGDYEAEDWIDGDGISDDRFRVCVTVSIRGDEMTFDFTGTCPIVAGPINCAFGALNSAVKTVFKSLVDPQAPANEGWFRPVTLVCPPGTIFTAEKPAPTGWYYEGSAHASELAWKALAEIAPDRFSAGSYMSLAASYFYGRDAETGEVYVHIEPAIGGWGATATRDGTSALIATTDGDTYNYSVELFEAKFPLAIRRYALNVADGAGVGRQRGGFGVVREFEVAGEEAHTYASIGRSIEKPWGLEGGGDGTNNYMQIASNGDVERVARIPFHALKSGDRVAVVTGGGGGFGDPLSRPVDAVAADVADEYITPEQARADYGVVVAADGTVDEAATASLRSGTG